MIRGGILGTYLLCLAGVSSVFAGILAGHSQRVSPPATEEGAAADQVLFTLPATDKDYTALPHTHLATTALSSTDQETLSGFERYIAGLGRLLAALQDQGRNWEAGTHIPSTAPDSGHHEITHFRDEIQKLFAFAGTMKRFSGAIKQKYPNDGALHATLTAAIADLLRLFEQYFGRQSREDEIIGEEEGREEERVDSTHVLVKTLEFLAEAHTNYTVAINAAKTPVLANLSAGGMDRIPDSSSLPHNSSSSDDPRRDYPPLVNITGLPAAAEASVQRPLDWHENQRGLLQVATQLKALLRDQTLGDDGSDNVPLIQPSVTSSTTNTDTTSTSTTTTTTTVTPKKPHQQPCLPPFELIAYRMCILQEMQLKLSWSDAQEFCRERGAELAQDMTVIKTRRFLNNLYGEDGTRSRWPVWVGGRRVEQTWKWAGDLEVPGFLWAPNEPRAYSSNLMPEGLCMILDGYRRFHGASLPCHLRRRFVCQLRD